MRFKTGKVAEKEGDGVYEDDEVDDTPEGDPAKGYDYLLSMPLWSLTFEKVCFAANWCLLLTLTALAAHFFAGPSSGRKGETVFFSLVLCISDKILMLFVSRLKASRTN